MRRCSTASSTTQPWPADLQTAPSGAAGRSETSLTSPTSSGRDCASTLTPARPLASRAERAPQQGACVVGKDPTGHLSPHIQSSYPSRTTLYAHLARGPPLPPSNHTLGWSIMWLYTRSAFLLAANRLVGPATARHLPLAKLHAVARRHPRPSIPTLVPPPLPSPLRPQPRPSDPGSRCRR